MTTSLSRDLLSRDREAAQSRPKNSTPTICHLLHSLTVGGAEVLAARMARWFSGPYRLVFACLDDVGTLGEQLRRDGFLVHLVGRRPGVDLGCARRLAKVLRDERVSVIHAHQYTPFFYAMLARWLSHHPPIVFTEHGRAHPDQRRIKRVIANRLLLERQDRVVGVGEAVRQALINNEGLRSARVAVIYNGINLSPFEHSNREREAVRRELGVGPHETVIMQVARLDALKDHSTAIRAMERVARQRPDVRLFIVGEGPELPRIEELIGKHQVAAQVRLLGLRKDVARLLAGADMFLLTSVSEGIPLTLIEAGAAGLPVVSTNVGGVAEVVDHERTGLLAPAGDDAALAAHLVRLADTSDLRRELGQAGQRRAHEEFSDEQMLASYGRLYQELTHK